MNGADECLVRSIRATHSLVFSPPGGGLVSHALSLSSATALNSPC
jgi:hypothetical protein